MTSRPVRVRAALPVRESHVPRRSPTSSSLTVLAALGVLLHSTVSRSAPPLPPATLPQLRGVVSGQALISSTVPGAARPRLTVNQATQRAIIDWKSFNIGSASEVQFIQPNASASALNRIYDASPSVIQGKLTANGQVLLINQNGILFDRGSQVNVQSLVASSLNITNQRFLSGVLTGGGLSAAAFAGGYDADGNSLPARPDGSISGAIVLGSGGAAEAAVPSLTANAGGSILLFGPAIDNQGGIIKAPDGQVILAAGQRVYLALNADVNDITLRGFLVEVEAAPAGSGVNLTNLIRNAGTIGADRGNVSLAALAVNQQGRISAKTAVQSNGSIYLTARARAVDADGSPTGALQSGALNFAAGSVTEVVPDAADATTVPDSQNYLAYRGVIQASGKTIANAGTLQVPGGLIVLNASDASDPTGARIDLSQGSVTSVAGAWADVDYRKNLQTFRVTSNELKNAPDQKNGILRGATVTVDLTLDNPILSLDGYRGAVARTVTEKAASGGELQIGSTGAVIQRFGAEIDASGGGYRYQSGISRTTSLLGDDGKIYDIATAPEQRRYTQSLDEYLRVDTRWGQTTRIANPLGNIGVFREGYSQGLNGGLVSISSNLGLVLDGTFNGGVTVGARQLANAPRGATLRIGDYTPSEGSFPDTQRIGNLTFRQNARDSLGADFDAASVLTSAQHDAFTLAASQVFGAARQTAQGLVESAFGTVELNVNGRIVLPADVTLASGVGGELILRAPQIDLAGDIRLPGGALTVQPVIPLTAPISPELATVTDRAIVRSGATLSTAGAWVNSAGVDGSFVGTPMPTGRLRADGSTARAVDGGDITLQIDDREFQTRLERGAVLDVGGGAAIDARRRISGGIGGVLSIATGTQNVTNPDWLQADLRGHALVSGGELNLSFARAVIGGAGPAPDASTTRLAPTLFSDYGFSKISIDTTDGIDVAAGTAVNVQQANLVIAPDAAAVLLPTGADLASIAQVQTLPASQRTAASVVLTARAGGAQGAATFTLNSGASITTDPRGAVTVSAVDGLDIDGRISAPGGSITATLRGPTDLSASALHLGSQAELSTAGVFIATPNDEGRVQGTLVNGGAVTLDARSAGLRVDAGARIDISGVNQQVDVATSDGAPGYVQRTLDGHAGTLTLRAQDRVVLNGTLLAEGGSATAAGGSVALELRAAEGQTVRPAERRIVVTAGPDTTAAASDTVDAAVDVRALAAAGVDKLRLQSENRIEFRGSADLDFERGIRLDAPLIELTDGALVNLRGSTVAIGQSLGARQLVSDGAFSTYQIVEGSASPNLPTRAGTGLLDVAAGAVDLYGNFTINGSRRTRIASDSDIRLIGRALTVESANGGQQSSRQVGRLSTAGNVELDAAQVYPATRSDFTIAVQDQPNSTSVAGGSIRVTANGAQPGSVYSAGGKLTLQADTVHQAGRLLAPLGEIDLRADSVLDLAAGSLTSVSGNDLTIPYGTTVSGILWRYVDGGVTPPTTLNAVTDAGKRITLTAPTIDVQPGSTVDLSGGGDVQAAEFVPGSGGDSDITRAANTYAVIPAARLQTSPYDRDTQAPSDPGLGFSLSSGRDTGLYDSLQIGAGGLLPAGEYTLLPARYALLPGAFLVELQTGTAYRNLQPGQATRLPNGQTVLAGFRSARGTSVVDSQSVGVVVRPGAAALLSSDYNLNGADFFASAAALGRLAAPRAPWDAGRLSIADATALTLNGDFDTAAARRPSQVSGRIAEVDIGGQRIAVVDHVGDAAVPAGFLQIEGASLSRLNASVLLGGKRSDADSGIAVETRASEVLIANSSAGAVTLPDLMLAATDRIDVLAGSVLTASGATTGGAPSVIASEASGALIRLGSGAASRVDRGTASSAAGDVRIAAGAVLSADGALLIDATRSTESQGQLRAGGSGGVGGSLSLSSSQVNLGDTAQATGALTGLVLSNSDLAAFGALNALVLRGYDAIDLIGTTLLGSPQLASLTLDTPLLRGRATADGQSARATIAAQRVELDNSTSTRASASLGSGSLTVQAEQLLLGDGEKAVGGFVSSSLMARDSVRSVGQGRLQVAGTLAMATPRVVAAGGSNQTVSAGDTSQADAPVYAALTLTGGPAPTATAMSDEPELGGRLTLEGQRVDVATAVQARSGQITLSARGSDSADGITLADGARLDARSQARNFNGRSVTADGGDVTLTATTGSVTVQAGAQIDVSAAAEGGGAGRLAVQATSLVLDGQLAGRAAAPARSGSADIDLGTLDDFSALNSALNAGGFAEARQLRLRSGDLAVASADVVNARRVTLAVDAGRLDVAGRIGSGAASGGARVELYARDDIALVAGSRVVANASESGARGGEVRIASGSGGLSFDAASTIDVRAGNAGPAGSVTFGVSRSATNALAPTALQGTVLRYSSAGLAAQAAGSSGDAPASVDVEATRVYNVSGSVTAPSISGYATDHAAFINASNPSAILGGLRDETGVAAGARLLGATELRSSGSLVLGTAWDLTNAQWLAGGRPGTLTVRAQGDLTISQSLGSPTDDILAGDTWNLRLVAGADLTAANPLATRARIAVPSGSLMLSGASARLRTGTGRIDLAAADNVSIGHVASSIYTGGRIGATDTEAQGNNRWAVDGGGISIRAGGDLIGAVGGAGDLWINEWLRRPRNPNVAFAALQPTDWWTYRPRFQQGVGTLAGGDIDIAAGGSISNLAAALPTTGRTYRDADNVRQVDVQGGGNLEVRAGEDVVGSSFFVARGQGRIDAAGDIGGTRHTQLYLAGVSSGDVPEGASIDLVAGGNVALQTISNPTALYQTSRDNSDATRGPSFGTQGSVSTFFTYSANSRAGVVAKSGDLTYDAVLASGWRSFNAVSQLTSNQTAIPGAYPASLDFVAFTGDITGPLLSDAITTFPSATASVAFLAGDSLINVGFHGADRSPTAVITPTTRFQDANNNTRQLSGVTGLQARAGDVRIVERDSDQAFVFDVQALDGSFTSSGAATTLTYTAPGRLRAGTDIVGANLSLQNLKPDDLSEVRADRGDFREPGSFEIRGPGQLLLQAGRNIDLGGAATNGVQGQGSLGGLVATGNDSNPQLPYEDSARISVFAGVRGDVNLAAIDAAYAEVIALNGAASDIIDLYRQLGTEPDAARVLAAGNIAALAAADPLYARFVKLDTAAPRALVAYQDALRANSLPLGPTADGVAAARLYALLNTETNVAALSAAGSIAALAATPGGAPYAAYVEFDQRYPRVFSDYLLRRREGAVPTGVTPIVFSNALAAATAPVVAPAAVSGGSLYSYQTSIQTYGGSGIDLWAPGGDIVVGLTTPGAATVGLLTNAGGAIRSVLSGDFSINQGRVITAQGGDILLYSSQGSIDAGRGAQTSLTTPAPVRLPILDADGNQIGVQVITPASAVGSGIRTLTSDPDGLGPLLTPKAGDIYLYAPAGAIDAGEAGIRSSGNIVINAQTVLNGSSISASGSSSGVPVTPAGSLAAALSSAGATNNSKSAEEAAAAATNAARAAAAAEGLQKPSILTVEVLGFGDKNCKEQQKDCFAK
ncbi:MAG: hypothetical protein CFE40_02425 [Burkholderiales bacterium PBB1]|nr:MAG: hypothetical protein CFE40_02425 [Burkholderiales bacterium PBB1]